MVSLILRRTVRRQLKVKGEGTGKPCSQLEDIEFVFPKEYNKILKPVFCGNYNYYAREENGSLAFILTPTKCTEDKSLIPDETVKSPNLEES
jgi:hypothetical protein